MFFFMKYEAVNSLSNLTYFCILLFSYYFFKIMFILEGVEPGLWNIKMGKCK